LIALRFHQTIAVEMLANTTRPKIRRSGQPINARLAAQRRSADARGYVRIGDEKTFAVALNDILTEKSFDVALVASAVVFLGHKYVQSRS